MSTLSTYCLSETNVPQTLIDDVSNAAEEAVKTLNVSHGFVARKISQSVLFSVVTLGMTTFQNTTGRQWFAGYSVEPDAVFTEKEITKQAEEIAWLCVPNYFTTTGAKQHYAAFLITRAVLNVLKANGNLVTKEDNK